MNNNELWNIIKETIVICIESEIEYNKSYNILYLDDKCKKWIQSKKYIIYNKHINYLINHFTELIAKCIFMTIYNDDCFLLEEIYDGKIIYTENQCISHLINWKYIHNEGIIIFRYGVLGYVDYIYLKLLNKREIKNYKLKS